MIPPVCPRILLCTACEESIITNISSKLSAPMTLTSATDNLIKHIRRLNLCQSSFVGLLTRLLRKETLGFMSGRLRFSTQLVFATYLLNKPAFLLSSGGDPSPTINNRFAAGETYFLSRFSLNSLSSPSSSDIIFVRY